jgi:hypothetical protein|tara:strand:+ start:206 stop:478 length:273 start_codon:yes stop_codon:yes gene_type:complete
MCIGNLFGGKPKAPAPPPRMTPAPPLPTPAPPPEMVSPEKVKEETEEEKLSTRKRKALEATKIREGVKTFGAVDASTMPQGPEGGITPPV